MIIAVGDIHGEFWFFEKIRERFNNDLPLIFIQVGDLGFWPRHMMKWPKKFPWPVYFIDGNHEHHPSLSKYHSVTEVRDNLFYIPRGTFLKLENKSFGFMGGGFSLDKRMREKNGTWFAEEDITESQVRSMLDNKVAIDYLVTHSPPFSVVRTHFHPVHKDGWGLKEEDDVDVTPKLLDVLWYGLGKPQLICGHMHKSIIGPGYRILSINEVLQIV